MGIQASVAVADFRGTGKPDIALVNADYEDIGIAYGDNMTLLLNAGDGTFSDNNRQTYPLAYGPGAHARFLAVGDFNNDGRPDLAFGLSQFNWVSVLLNRPDTTRLDVTALTTAVAGDVLSVTVTARTADGSISSFYTGRVHFSTTDPIAVLPPDYTFTEADQGTHTFQVSLRRAGNQQITIADAANHLTAGANVLVSPADTSKFIVSGLPTPVRAGTVSTFFVSTRDNFDNLTTSYRGTVQFSSSDPQATLPQDYAFTDEDHGTHGFAVVLKTAGTQTLTAVDSLVGDLRGSQTVVVTPAAVTALAVTGFATPTVAGTVHTFTVAAKDAYGNTVTDYRGKIHLTSSDHAATLPDDYTFVAGDGGSRLFGAILQTAGVQSLTASDTAHSLSGTQKDIQVTPAAASYFVLSAPEQVQADTVFEVTVTAYDAYGNVATGYLGTVGFSSSDPDALVPQDYTFTADDAGTHVFRFLLHEPGRQTITAIDRLMSSLTGTTLLEVVPPG